MMIAALTLSSHGQLPLEMKQRKPKTQLRCRLSKRDSPLWKARDRQPYAERKASKWVARARAQFRSFCRSRAPSSEPYLIEESNFMNSTDSRCLESEHRRKVLSFPSSGRSLQSLSTCSKLGTGSNLRWRVYEELCERDLASFQTAPHCKRLDTPLPSPAYSRAHERTMLLARIRVSTVCKPW